MHHVAETQFLGFFAGALHQFQLFDNIRKEQSNVCQVALSTLIKFLAAPLFSATYKLLHVSTAVTKMRFVATA